MKREFFTLTVRKSIGVVHCVATCETCGAEFSSHKNGQALAAKHAKQKAHLVHGEVGLAFTYDGRDEKPTKSLAPSNGGKG